LTFNLMKGTVSRAVAFLKPTSLAYWREISVSN
jgi:hypothetical protein